jgi:hypothetical protein
MGDKLKKTNAQSPQYTDSYLLVCGLDSSLGVKHMFFTHNPVFQRDGARWSEVEGWCQDLGLDVDQIVFGEPKIKGSKYCKESTEQVSHFQAVYRHQLHGTRVLHDAGNAFKFEGDYILADGAEMHSVLPPIQHAEFSPLDNKLNAVAKEKWRSLRQNKDYAYDALLLLKCAQDVEQKHISKWFKSNFMMDTKDLSLEVVMAELSKVKDREIFRQEEKCRYFEAYHDWNGRNIIG